VTEMATTLIGREPELAVIATFLDRAAAGGGVLLFTGEPGVGKTAILDAAGDAAVAAGTIVLRAAGGQFVPRPTSPPWHAFWRPCLASLAS
jgi:hypothetical protein